MKTDSVFFYPWIGKDYHNGGVFGNKLLILGESHYCGNGCDGCGTDLCAECHSFTTNVIKEYLNPDLPRKDWMRTFVKFERSLVNHITEWEERQLIWDSVAFYNYLQISLNDARQSGTRQQYVDAIDPFFKVLDNLKPDLMIVWGYRLWDLLPETNWKNGEEKRVGDYRVCHGRYTTSTGFAVRTVCVYHPSAGYSWDFWYKVIKSVCE